MKKLTIRIILYIILIIGILWGVWKVMERRNIDESEAKQMDTLTMKYILGECELFYYKHNVYPKTIEELEKEGLSKDQEFDKYGRKFEIIINKDKQISILSLGKDGIRGAKDNIIVEK